MDLLVAWEWKFDAEFIKIFESMAVGAGLNCLFINPATLNEASEKIQKEKIVFKALLDRASDVDASFDFLIDRIILSGSKTFNDASNAFRAMDKATMHLEFLTKGLDVPYTIILSPKDDVNSIKEKDLKQLGRPFIIKPSRGGGGIGVVVGAETLVDIMNARKVFSEDKYLLQEKVVPAILEGRRAYFRVFYACGKVISCWWDDHTHIFFVLTKEEESKHDLSRLKDITKTIAEISRLDFFSTEICVTDNKRFVVVDYVNDPCDMRPKSIYVDGVPDEVVREIISELIVQVKKTPREQLTPAKKEILTRRRDFELALLRRYRVGAQV